MITWLMENLSTILIGAVLVVIIFFALRRVIKDHKTKDCKGGCAGCPMADKCYPNKKED